MTGNSFINNLSSITQKPLSLSDATCHICFDIQIETVKLPCNHELCMICANSLSENKNFLCPMCRKAIPELYRSNMELLIDDEKWTQIKETFSNEVIRRLLDLNEFNRISKKVTLLFKDYIRQKIRQFFLQILAAFSFFFRQIS